MINFLKKLFGWNPNPIQNQNQITDPVATLAAAEVIASNLIYNGFPATVVAVNGTFTDTQLGRKGVSSFYFAPGVVWTNALNSTMFTFMDGDGTPTVTNLVIPLVFNELIVFVNHLTRATGQ